MIEVSNLIKKYDDFTALDETCMHVKTGTVYGLVGLNGAGKTTLIRHLAGVIKQDAGQVKVMGEEIWENVSVKRHIAYIPDELYFYPKATVRELQKFYKGMYPDFSDEKFQQLQEIFSEIPLKKPIRRMSKGMQKQVAFWMAISCCPKLLLLDEPVDGLDPLIRKKVWGSVLAEVMDRQMTVLVSSHNLRELEDVCDHVGIMRQGKVVLEDSLESLQQNTCKLQVSFADEPLPEMKELEIKNCEKEGRLFTLIVSAPCEEAMDIVRLYKPEFVNPLQMNLEELFIYELEEKIHG